MISYMCFVSNSVICIRFILMFLLVLILLAKELDSPHCNEAIRKESRGTPSRSTVSGTHWVCSILLTPYLLQLISMTERSE